MEFSFNIFLIGNVRGGQFGTYFCGFFFSIRGWLIVVFLLELVFAMNEIFRQ